MKPDTISSSVTSGILLWPDEMLSWPYCLVQSVQIVPAVQNNKDWRIRFPLHRSQRIGHPSESVGNSRGWLYSSYEISPLELVMESAKRAAIDLIRQLPDDTSLEEIQYHLYVREKVDRGLHDLKTKRILSQREVERRMSKWLKG